MKNVKSYLSIIIIVLMGKLYGQTASIPVIKLSDDSKNFIKITLLNQVWARYTELNPYSTLNGYSMPAKFDIGIRRMRMQVIGQLTNKVFIYTQFGLNNFNDLNKRYQGAFFHDMVTEYHFNQSIQIGGGLTGWSGLSRYAAPAIGSLLSLDAPLFLQTTNGINDQLLRKLSIYAKGQLGKWDYRLAITDPLAIQNSTSAIGALGTQSEFNPYPAKIQLQGYLKYQFFDKESNLTPYQVGSYLGQKKVLAIGGGAIHQSNAMWNKNSNGDTLLTNMDLFSVDVFYENRLNAEKENALTVYLSASHFGLGQDYIHTVGVMNPVNGSANSSVISGAGNAFPAIGNGNTLYGQLGYLFGKRANTPARFQIYNATQVSIYDRLNSPMIMSETGLNFYTQGTQLSKLTLNWQIRPIFMSEQNGKGTLSSYKSMVQIQYQISI